MERRPPGKGSSPPSPLRACRRLDDKKIVECVNKGLDKALGFKAKDTVLNALKIVYDLEQKDIPSSLDVFAASITKMFGEFAAERILDLIDNECRREEDRNDNDDDNSNSNDC